MMQRIKFILIMLIAAGSVSAFADPACESAAKTRDDFLACTAADTNKALMRARKLYESIRPAVKGEKLRALDANFSLWNTKIRSDCELLGNAFNDWGDAYSPDSYFQIAECRLKIASQQLEFYSWLACPDEIETSKKPNCAALKKILAE